MGAWKLRVCGTAFFPAAPSPEFLGLRSLREGAGRPALLPGAGPSPTTWVGGRGGESRRLPSGGGSGHW